MRKCFSLMVVALIIVPSLLYGQQSFIKFNEGDPRKMLLKNFHFIKLDDDLIKLPNIINVKLLLPTYKDYNNNSDTIVIEQLLYAAEWKNLTIVIGNLFGLKRSVALVFDANRENNSPAYAKEDNYIEEFVKSKTDSLLFFQFKTKYLTNCSEEKTFFIFSFNLKNGFFNKAFSEISDIEYFFNEPFCRKGRSYKTTCILNTGRNRNQESLLSNKKIGGRKVIKKYKFKNNMFVL